MTPRIAPSLMFVAAAALVAGGQPASAAPEEAVASARPAPAADAADAADAQIRQYLDDAVRAPAGDDGPAADGSVSDGKPHGEVGVGIGTGGYRHAHASTVVPVGEVGTAAIGVSDTRWTGRGGAQRKQQSLSVAVDLGRGAAGAQTAPMCARPSDRRGPEPLWATRMRAEQAAASGTACVPRD
jgi:hypothetical protein